MTSKAPPEIYLYETKKDGVFLTWANEPSKYSWITSHKYIRADIAKAENERLYKVIEIFDESIRTSGFPNSFPNTLALIGQTLKGRQ